MRYFLDTEFVEGDGFVDIVSLGVVSEDNREFYMESSEVNWGRASDWVLENVRPFLDGKHPRSRYQIGRELIEFVGGDKKPEFWAYYGDYDWVAVCSCFGTMMDLPEHFPMFCMDLKQSVYTIGNPKLPDHDEEQDGPPHNALADARWTKRAHAWLMAQAESSSMDRIREFRETYLQQEFEDLAKFFGRSHFTEPEIVAYWKKTRPRLGDPAFLIGRTLDFAHRLGRLEIYPPNGGEARMSFKEAE